VRRGYEVKNMKNGIRNIEYGEWSIKYGIGNIEYKAGSELPRYYLMLILLYEY